MKKNRLSEEQIIGILKQGEPGVKTTELFREHGKRRKRLMRDLRSPCRLPQRMNGVVQKAPARNDATAPQPSTATVRLPKATLSAMAKTMPDICDVY